MDFTVLFSELQLYQPSRSGAFHASCFKQAFEIRNKTQRRSCFTVKRLEILICVSNRGIFIGNLRDSCIPENHAGSSFYYRGHNHQYLATDQAEIPGPKRPNGGAI